MMAWFTRRKTDQEAPDEDANRLREALDWMLDAWEPMVPNIRRARLTRLQERLEETPSPTGLMNEIRALAPRDNTSTSTSADTPPAEEPEPNEAYGNALGAIAYAMREASLLDDSLAAAIESFARSVPVNPGRGDAKRLAREAETLEQKASPVRARAVAERREIARIVATISEALGGTTGRSSQLVDGLQDLGQRLEQSADPQGLRLIRQEAIRRVSSLQQEASALRGRLQQAEAEASSLKSVVEEQSRLISQIRDAAARDPLTGLLNRGAFDAAFATQIRNNRQRKRPITLVILDIDHFKHVNDTWGHPVGDQVLRVVAERLSRLVREGDVVARVGGEEFAILLPRIGARKAAQVAERIRADIERQSFSASGTVFRVTLSIGLDALNGNEDPERLYARVDQALYAAKEGGRNRVVAA